MRMAGAVITHLNRDHGSPGADGSSVSGGRFNLVDLVDGLVKPESARLRRRPGDWTVVQADVLENNRAAVVQVSISPTVRSV